MLQLDSDSPIECIKHRMMIKRVYDTAHIFSSSFSLQVIIEQTLSRIVTILVLLIVHYNYIYIYIYIIVDHVQF